MQMEEETDSLKTKVSPWWSPGWSTVCSTETTKLFKLGT